MSEVFKKLEEPLFIKISFYPTPESPADWKGYAVQTAGNDMYGKVILLENTYKNPDSWDMPLFEEIEVCEWEWNGGFPVEGEELLHVKQLYEEYLKKEKSKKEIDIKNMSTEIKSKNPSPDFHPDITALVLMHAIDENSFEIESITFPAIENISKELEKTLPKEDYYYKMLDYDRIMEEAAEELNQYGSTSKIIHEELWKKYPYEKYHCFTIDLSFTCNKNYRTGDVDINVNYEYQLSDIKKEWQNLDLLQKGSKIYYIDYEENGSSYTVHSIFEASKETEKYYLIPGIYYNAHSDKLSNITGYYSIADYQIDAPNGHFFSTPEKAHEAYIKFKNKEQEEMEK